MDTAAPDPVAVAKSYPFDVPDHSFLFVDGRAPRLVGFRPARPEDCAVVEDGRETPLADYLGSAGLDAATLGENRWPVIACGSNASPRRLADKFAPLGGGGVIPVTRVRLDGFSVVYSAHFAAYGSIPATLRRMPGDRAEAFVTWLTRAQLERMHETEALGRNYGFMRLAEGETLTEGGDVVARPLAYVSLHGCLANDGAPVGLPEFAHDGASPPSATQIEALTLARDLLEPRAPLDRFISEGIADEALRRLRTNRLRALGLPFSTAGLAPA